MSGLEPLILPALIGSTALTAGGQIMAGHEKSAAAAFEQQQLQGQQEQLKIQAENQRIAAMQAEARRREDLVSNYETIMSVRSGRGVGQASPTGMAVLDSLINTGERDIGTERFNMISKADASSRAAANAGLASEMAGRRARTSLLAGYMGAGATVGDAFYKANTYTPRRV